eukprot:95658-Chlamydomonas_euryale.AAC.1
MSIPKVNQAGGVFVSTPHYAAIYSPDGFVTSTHTKAHDCVVFEQPKSDGGDFSITTASNLPKPSFSFATLPGN